MANLLRYLILDFETTVVESFKRKANPFDSRNKVIVAVSKLPQDTSVTTQYEVAGITKVNLDYSKFDVIVGHNLKFDLLWIWQDLDFIEWLKKGGKVYDTMVGEYFLSAQRHLFASLNDCAKKAGGTIKDQRLEEFFDAGVGADKIDPDILLPYAQADIINTELVFLDQIKRAEKLQLLPFLSVQMDHLLAITEMEFNGLHFDTKAAEELQVELEARYAELKDYFRDLVKSHCDVEFEFNVDSPEHVSALLFNTPLVIATKEQIGVFGPNTKKPGAPRYKINRLEVVVNVLNLDRKLSRPYKKKGVFSSDKEILYVLKPFAPEIVSNLTEYRDVAKTLKTYIYGHNKKGEETGLIPLVTPWDNCIHHTLNQTNTVTGRLSSKNPNMQNITKKLKHLFSSRFEGGEVYSFDYSQLEIWLQAYLSGSEKMLQDLLDGVDFHIKRLAYAESLEYETALAHVKSGDPVWKEKRSDAKQISYAKAYGAHPAKISKKSGLPVHIVEKVFKCEKIEYPEVDEFLDSILKEVERTRVPTGKQLAIYEKVKDDQGNVLDTIGPWYNPGTNEGIGYWTSVTRKRYAFTETGAYSTKMREAGRDIMHYFSTTEMANYPNQGLASDIMSLTCGRVFRYLLENDLRKWIKLINEVHDSLMTDTAPEGIQYMPKVKEILEDVEKPFFEKFGVPFTVPLRVDIEHGTHWE